MALQVADITLIEDFTDYTNLTTYEGASQTFAANTLYLLFVGSEDTTAGTKPVTITTTGITWVEAETFEDADLQQTCYRAVPTSGTTSTTQVEFDSQQEDCYWTIVEVDNADISGVNGANAIIQDESDSETGSSFTHTLTSAVSAGNLVICSIVSLTSRVWTSGPDQTNLTTSGGLRNSFVEYNLDADATVTATTDNTVLKIGIVLEVASGTAPTLTLPTSEVASATSLSGTVTTDADNGTLYTFVSQSIDPPTTAIHILGTGADYWDDQTVSAAGLQTISPDMTGLTEGVTYYVHYYHVSSGGGSNQVTASVASVTTLHTLELIDKTTIVTAGSFVVGQRYEILVPGTTDFTLIGAADSNIGTVFTATGVGVGDGTALHIIPCVCESTDFALGVTAELWPAGVSANKEVASSVVAIDTANTANPQYNVTFTVAPDSGSSDVVNIIYDATVGNIKSVTGGIALASGSFNDATMTC